MSSALGPMAPDGILRFVAFFWLWGEIGSQKLGQQQSKTLVLFFFFSFAKCNTSSDGFLHIICQGQGLD